MDNFACRQVIVAYASDDIPLKLGTYGDDERSKLKITMIEVDRTPVPQVTALDLNAVRLDDLFRDKTLTGPASQRSNRSRFVLANTSCGHMD